MSNVIGEPLESYVAEQINVRQTLHGSGVDDVARTDIQINILNSNTSWIKLGSGVSISGSRLEDIGFSKSQQELYGGMGLAKNNILFGGTAALDINKVETDKGEEKYDVLKQRSGFNPRDPNSSYTYSEFGFSPMAGIESADIKTLGRGSLKKATVKLKANDRKQFDIIDLLYLRLGYTVLLEWGNTFYSRNGVNKIIIRNTLMEEMFFDKTEKGSYLDLLDNIENKRNKYAGNYDGLFGKVSNFSWSFNTDGTYDIELTIISLGDVIESLKTNLSVDKGTFEFLSQTGAFTPDTPDQETEQPPEPQIIENSKDADIISAMLYTWKWLNQPAESLPFGLSLPSPNPKVQIITPDRKDEPYNVGNILFNSQKGGDGDTITSTEYVIEFKAEYWIRTGKVSSTTALPEIKKITEIIDPGKIYSQKEFEEEKYVEDIKKFREEYIKKGLAEKPTLIKYKIVNQTNQEITNPLKDAPYGSAFVLNTKEPNYYLRFGYLLKYIKDNILPRIVIGDKHDDNPSIFDIDYYAWDNYMYSIPNQISVDPKVCIVKNDNFESGNGIIRVFKGLNRFREADGGADENQFSALPLNIYLNFNFIIECLKKDDRGDVNLYEFISSICTGLNKALGGINNLEPIIDENSNTLKIIDTTPIPGRSGGTPPTPYLLQLYGYDKTNNGYISNFIRKVDLKTVIDPGFATMITVGATAGGYVKGTEATAFSKWNTGLIDRYKENFEPGNLASVKKTGEIDEAEVNYVNEFLSSKVFVSRYGFDHLPPNPFTIVDDLIQRNTSIVTEYYKYLLSKNKADSGGTIGFIPFKISFTMDGLSGIKIYNKLEVNTEFLPKAYGKNNNLIVTGVTHRLSNNDWETDIEATLIPKSTKLSGIKTSYNPIQDSIDNVISNEGNEPKVFTSGTGIYPLKNLIAKYESFNGDYNVYNFGKNGAKGIRTSSEGLNSKNYYTPKAVNISKLTVQETLDYKGQGVDGTYIFAAGKYQMIPVTRREIAKKLGLLNKKFDSTIQEQLGDYLLLERKSNLGKYLKGKNKGTAKELALAVQDIGKVFASFPVIWAKDGTQVGSVINGSGRIAYYGGEGINPSKSKITIADVVQAIIKSRIQYSNFLYRPEYIPSYYKD